MDPGRIYGVTHLVPQIGYLAGLAWPAARGYLSGYQFI